MRMATACLTAPGHTSRMERADPDSPNRSLRSARTWVVDAIGVGHAGVEADGRRLAVPSAPSIIGGERVNIATQRIGRRRIHGLREQGASRPGKKARRGVGHIPFHVSNPSDYEPSGLHKRRHNRRVALPIRTSSGVASLAMQ